MDLSPLPVMYLDLKARDPDLEDAHSKYWFAPAANVVVEAIQVSEGATLVVEDNPDESVIILSNDAPTVRVTAGEDSEEVTGRALVIVPPGASTCEALSDGWVYRTFSCESPRYQAAVDLVGDPGWTGTAPFAPWEAPPRGFKLRVYRLSDYAHVEGRRRIFRSSNLMVAMGESRTEPRPPEDLNPHTHGDFQQISLVTAGTYIHHLRRPWGRDSNAWCEDLHMPAAVPSILVIDSGDVHTSQNLGTGPWYLIDIFGPPRKDFTEKGFVLNSEDYPNPADLQAAGTL